ncbi:UNVERIFIED_CONTAM: hypothetical protein Sangu_1012900 [Sesamum angustifolium]|uniref:SET domain-containing protein n=1 Tax=Sesamum angustifolium TaxID=2727405 RepID=A0AAW2PFN2_9LAMI
MAEASRILQTTLVSTFSQNPSQYTLKAHSHHYVPPSTSKRSSLFHRIRCSVSTTSTGGESATGTTVPWGCDVESLENASALQEWLSKCGLPPQKMAIQRVDVWREGLVALKNIRKGEKLLFVPPSLFITADSVRLPSMDGKVALVPWADMLNHSCEVETFLDYDKSSQGVVFTTDRAYQPGEQVFISYGKKSNGELLLSYGFVPGEGTNPRDSVELSLSLKKSDKCYKEKLEALKKHGLSASECFPIQITGWPVELMAYAYLTVSPPSMKNRFDEMAAAASNKMTSKKDVVYPEIEEEALQFILDMCEASISKYAKFLQASKWIDGFGRDKSEASEPKTVLETASCGFMYQRTEDTLSRTICKGTLNLRSLVTVFIHFKQCRRLTRRAGGKSLSYH